MKISFLSGTRADYSKIKPYIDYLLENQKDKEIYVFITGMHMLSKYGDTCQQIKKDLEKTCHLVFDTDFTESNTSQEVAHIISAYDQHLQADHIDFVFVHGDRPEALAGAFAARLNNIPVCQIEAGDLSGSIDDSIRHAITKLSHRFLVADKPARKVLLLSGENKKDIFITGNSSLTSDFSEDESLFQKYHIPFDKYAILVYHPVTTLDALTVQEEIQTLMSHLVKSNLNYIVIMPNNDLHHQVILTEYQKYVDNPHFCFFKSLPVEVFTPLLKKALFLIGNSSCGIKEAPYYSVPTIDVGVRQQNRYNHLKNKNFHHLKSFKGLDKLIRKIVSLKRKKKTVDFKTAFLKRLNTAFSTSFWKPDIQKDVSAFSGNSPVKKICRWSFLFLFLSTLLGLSVFHFKDQLFPPKTAHVYIDLASAPSVFQMADALQQNPKDPKLIILKRFKALDPNDEVLTSMNAQMVDAQFLGERNYDKFPTLIDKNLLSFYVKHNKCNFVIHLNEHHAFRSGHFEKIIPQNQIKAIHLYDDSLGRSLWDSHAFKNYAIFASKYPTYMHLGYYDTKKPSINPDYLIPMDFRKIANSLSPLQRKKLARLLGIDFKRIKNLFKNKPIAVFADDPDLDPKNAEKFIQFLIQKYPDSPNYYWLYKNHPRVSEPGPAFNLLHKYFKSVTVIPNKVPLESLLSIGFQIDFVAGYGSSIFYSFQKEQILGYIHRIRLEAYEQSLLDLGILTPDLIFNLSTSQK